MLTAVFGGFFIGAGIGLAVRGGAVLDGTEIAALLISKRSHLLKVGDVILLFNVVLFVLAMTLLGVEEALYSILTYVAAARTLDFVIHGIEEFTAITIVSRMSGEIGAHILAHLGRGVTVYKGRGGLSGEDQEILLCVVTRLEIGKVKSIVRQPRSRRVRDDACAGGCGWGDGEAGAALMASPQPAIAWPSAFLRRGEEPGRLSALGSPVRNVLPGKPDTRAASDARSHRRSP